MINTVVKKKVLAYHWEPWMERPFGAFILSLFKNSTTRTAYRQIGVDVKLKMFLFERGAWYKSHKVNEDFARQLERYLARGGSIFKVSRSCEKFYRDNKKKILHLAVSSENPLRQFRILYDLISPITAYIWLAHGLEDVYTQKLRHEASKHMSGDVDKFIGDISFPVKKNAHVRLEAALRRGDDLRLLLDRFGWMKARDGFAPPFTLAEMRELQRKAKAAKPEVRPRTAVPSSLRPLAKAAQELVYFRTLRTDILYEFLFLARPITQAAAKQYGLSFDQLKNYSVPDLIGGEIKSYPNQVTTVGCDGELFFFSKPILPAMSVAAQEIKGQIAYVGIIRGEVKIVKTVKDLKKVRAGDILVTQMTFPFPPLLRP